ncbi:MAG: WYL domain-containing protein [Kangiellaceae bacterium]|nr:WYL domain-containing protein [Kangiellaceae bacterium]MCW9016488.1 WYL domain-containing protein [Kangiellaceae bacterium]
MKQPQSYRWDLLLRYRLIEIIALWEGRLTTKSLIQAFGIGRQQASKDINNYIKTVAPNNLQYDKQLKGYKPSTVFNPKLTKGSIDEYLHLLASRRDQVDPVEQVDFSQANTAILAPPPRNISPSVIRPIIQACRESKRLDIRYLSMSSEIAKERIISPHTIVYSGMRWHVRAFCEDRQDFRDFVLSRVCEVFDLEGFSEKDADQDTAWQTFVNIKIKPDPRLSDHQKSIIATDYGMQNQQLRLNVRAALVTYFLQLLNLDHELISDNPLVQQIVLTNSEELGKWRF